MLSDASHTLVRRSTQAVVGQLSGIKFFVFKETAGWLNILTFHSL